MNDFAQADVPGEAVHPVRGPRRAYLLWASALLVVVGLLLAGEVGPDARRALSEVIRPFLTWRALGMALMALGCEYVDSTLGMGYGTTLTPLLIIGFGVAPLQIVPAVLLSELATGATSAALHHGVGNVDFRRSGSHLRVAGLIGLMSVVGTLGAVLLAVHLPKRALTLYIGALVTVVGAVILATRRTKIRFSWAKVTALALVASFNKGISGGGYGPVVTGGQLLSGVDAKPAVGITSAAESLTCAVGIAAYLAAGQRIDARLALPLVVGAMLSVPVAVNTVRIISAGRLRTAVGVLTVGLGLWTLGKLILS